jgi:tRNA(fMet)-specific endonuclease VapC
VSVALDTNTLSYYLRGEGRVAERLQALSPQQVALPAVVVYEIRFGLQRVGREVLLAAFDALIKATTVLPFDAEAARHAADIRVDLQARGLPIGPHDVLIAATARRHARVLVTHNTREFSRVRDLTVEDWY